MTNAKVLVYSDLDGSLLNHDDYNYEAAKPLIAHLERDRVPLILNTSKTRAELLSLRKALDNHHPFITENGAAVFIPAGYFEHQPEGVFLQDHYWVKAFVEPRAQWQAVLHRLSPDIRAAYESFSYKGVEGIMRATGLSNVQASLASQREYGEPLEWCSGEELKRQLIAAVTAAGGNVLEGGRFMHISGHCNKGDAMLWLSEQYAKANQQQTPINIAIGDSSNDIAMLNIADHAVVVKSPSKPYPTLKPSAKAVYTEAIAPEGWVEGLSTVLNSLPHN